MAEIFFLLVMKGKTIKGTLMYIHCFMRRDVICRGQIPWIIFVSVKEFLHYLKELTLIEVEDFKIDNVLKLLKERINKKDW